jgi:4'-phosphopantetheinyl transferase
MNAPPIDEWRGRVLGVELRAFPLPEHLDEADLDQLSDAERVRAAGFAASRRRIEYVTARAQLRRTLGAVLGAAPPAIPIAADDFGKPQHAGGLQFNLSHSGRAVLIGWGDRPLGVDVETAQRPARYVGRLKIVADVAAATRLGAIAAFTLVEAASKAVGRGVGALKGMTLLSVDGANEVRFATRDGVAIRAAPVALTNDYVGAVAVLD